MMSFTDAVFPSANHLFHGFARACITALPCDVLPCAVLPCVGVGGNGPSHSTHALVKSINLTKANVMIINKQTKKSVSELFTIGINDTRITRVYKVNYLVYL